MHDPTLDLQAKDGGWRQGNIESLRDQHLWGSAYAADFLYSCIENAEALDLSSNVKDHAKKRYKSLFMAE